MFTIFREGGLAVCISSKPISFYGFDVVIVWDINVAIESCYARWATRFSGTLLKLGIPNINNGRNLLTEWIDGQSSLVSCDWLGSEP